MGCCCVPCEDSTTASTAGGDRRSLTARVGPGTLFQGPIPQSLVTLQRLSYSNDGLRVGDPISLDPFFRESQLRLEREGYGGGCTSYGYASDVSFPSDVRSDCSALTSVYRGGQNHVLEYLDKNSFHGLNLAYTDGQYYDWDGVTTRSIFFPDTYTQAEADAFRLDWYNWLFPGNTATTSNYVARGLAQLYTAVQPFADETAPTVAEFENWNLRVINHIRSLLQLPPAVYKHELFLNCQWSDERNMTTLWDTLYPGTFDSAYGPCVGGSNIHCGETFAPTLQSEQDPYWNDYYCGYPCIPSHDLVPAALTATAGRQTFMNGTAFTAMSRMMRAVDGVISGHGAMFFKGKEMGYSIYGTGGGGIRHKWLGSDFVVPPGYTY